MLTKEKNLTTYSPAKSDIERVLSILDDAATVLDLPSDLPIGLYSREDSFSENLTNSKIETCRLLEPTPLGPGPMKIDAKRIPLFFPQNQSSSSQTTPDFLVAESDLIINIFKDCMSDSFSGGQNDKDALRATRYRQYQCEQWNERFHELVSFHAEHGHCMVPLNYPLQPQLGQWVKRQRYQYKLKQNGRSSTLSDQRQNSLMKLGFVWDSHEASWMEHFQHLVAFKERYGHCSVPSKYSDRSLAVWVKFQRRQCKLFAKGKKSAMTKERLLRLEVLGFDWNPRNLS